MQTILVANVLVELLDSILKGKALYVNLILVDRILHSYTVSICLLSYNGCEVSDYVQIIVYVLLVGRRLVRNCSGCYEPVAGSASPVD